MNGFRRTEVKSVQLKETEIEEDLARDGTDP